MMEAQAHLHLLANRLVYFELELKHHCPYLGHDTFHFHFGLRLSVTLCTRSVPMCVCPSVPLKLKAGCLQALGRLGTNKRQCVCLHSHLVSNGHTLCGCFLFTLKEGKDTS